MGAPCCNDDPRNSSGEQIAERARSTVEVYNVYRCVNAARVTVCVGTALTGDVEKPREQCTAVQLRVQDVAPSLCCLAV